MEVEADAEVRKLHGLGVLIFAEGSFAAQEVVFRCFGLRCAFAQGIQAVSVESKPMLPVITEVRTAFGQKGNSFITYAIIQALCR